MYKKIGILAIAAILLLFTSAETVIGRQSPGNNSTPVVVPADNGTWGYLGDITIQGTAISKFNRIGAWGWVVHVETIVYGPPGIQGKAISVYLTSADPKKYPPGYLDPAIRAGDIVEAYGGPVSGSYNILLTGDSNYYLKRISKY